jgi:hypothetical protein
VSFLSLFFGNFIFFMDRYIKYPAAQPAGPRKLLWAKANWAGEHRRARLLWHLHILRTSLSDILMYCAISPIRVSYYNSKRKLGGWPGSPGGCAIHCKLNYRQFWYPSWFLIWSNTLMKHFCHGLISTHWLFLFTGAMTMSCLFLDQSTDEVLFRIYLQTLSLHHF